MFLSGNARSQCRSAEDSPTSNDCFANAIVGFERPADSLAM
ncbi:hypothetical protein RE6C_03298 [Rhodopirellula europaea 6C]|uniref:Uncharacterized protein n=1 Tax=Rhodopirellula europaea 6C TaxID=1263867 RepID=M2A632_9BACT|nr:hypothetical protein RE6C_03298 [Rhodopirellula europaea 6C]